MRKRVALARTLVYDPPVILMDEPFSTLDTETRTLLQEDLLRLWCMGRKTIVFVTHDIGEAIALGDRVLVLSRGPARVRSQQVVDLARPRAIRDLTIDPVFQQLYRRVRAECELACVA
jgi:NitT/TauT family transport system ATP-binding protein